LRSLNVLVLQILRRDDAVVAQVFVGAAIVDRCNLLALGFLLAARFVAGGFEAFSLLRQVLKAFLELLLVFGEAGVLEVLSDLAAEVGEADLVEPENLNHGNVWYFVPEIDLHSQGHRVGNKHESCVASRVELQETSIARQASQSTGQRSEH